MEEKKERAKLPPGLIDKDLTGKLETRILLQVLRELKKIEKALGCQKY